MGLAVLQQLNNKFEPSLFEHGKLANMFAQAGNSQREGSFLRLVDKVQSNLSNASDSVIHSFEGFSDQERNIKSYNDIAEEDTFDYGIKELMKGPQDHDENISADNGYTKLGNVSPAGNNEKKARENWRFAFQMQMQRQQQEFMARLRELDKEIKSLQGIQDFLKDKTSADFDGNTEEGRKNIEELKSRLNEIKDGKRIEDFTDAHGNIDVKAANEYAKERERQAQNESNKIIDQNPSLARMIAQPDAKTQNAPATETASASDFAAGLANMGNQPVAMKKDVAAPPSQNAFTSVEAQEVSVAAQNDPQTTDAAQNSPFGNAFEDVASIENDSPAEVALAEPSKTDMSRSFTSVAASMDEERTSVISAAFTKLAYGTAEEGLPLNSERSTPSLSVGNSTQLSSMKMA